MKIRSGFVSNSSSSSYVLVVKLEDYRTYLDTQDEEAQIVGKFMLEEQGTGVNIQNFNGAEIVTIHTYYDMGDSRSFSFDEDYDEPTPVNPNTGEKIKDPYSVWVEIPRGLEKWAKEAGLPYICCNAHF